VDKLDGAHLTNQTSFGVSRTYVKG
jgi:hypothetical protein